MCFFLNTNRPNRTNMASRYALNNFMLSFGCALSESSNLFDSRSLARNLLAVRMGTSVACT